MQGNRIHEFAIVIHGQMRCPVAQAAQKRIQPIVIGLGEIAQHISGHGILVPRMSDAQPHTFIIGPHMRMKRPQPIVARMAAAHFYTAFAGGQVQFIMKHNDISRGNFVKPRGFANRLARKVHKGFWFQQQNFCGAQMAFAHAPLKFSAPRAKPMRIGDAIQRHEPDIMTVLRLFCTRVSQANE